MYKRDKIQIGKRLTKLLESLNIKSSRQFAMSIDMDPSYLAKAEKGEAAISDKYVENLQKVHSINPEWLLYGKGEMYGTNVPHETNEPIPGKTPEKPTSKPETTISEPLLSLIESNRLSAESMRIFAESHLKVTSANQELTSMLHEKKKPTGYDQLGISEAFAPMWKEALTVLAEIGTGKGWKTKEEGLTLLNKRIYGHLKKAQTKGIHDGEGIKSKV